MSLYTKLVSKTLFPLHERLKGHDTVSVLDRMMKSQWLSNDEVQELQFGRLKEFLVYIDKNIPYYNQIFKDLHVDPCEVQDLSILQALPLLTKDLIRKNFDSLTDQKYSKFSRFNTGGSSGEPLVFLVSKERISHDVAAKWRATRWWDVDIGDPEIVIWGSPIELKKQDYVKILRDRILRTSLISAFELSEKNIRKYIQTIKIKKPKMLFGYPSALSVIARYAQAKGVELGNVGIKVAFVTSEKLYPYQREIIEQVFACKVANGYGGRDAGFIAHQCPEGAMHITAEDIIVEIIDHNGKPVPVGESGEIVITHLGTRHFPFLRYRTGDIGRLGDKPCPCGRGLPVLADIEGRDTDFIVMQDGSLMHGLALIYILREYENIAEFKITQETVTDFSVDIVAQSDFQSSQRDAIASQFKARLGENVNVAVKLTSEIQPEKSGKYRYVVSKVKQ